MARPTGPQDYKSSSFSQRKDDRFSAKEVTAEGESVLQAGETLVRVHTSDAKFYESAADADALGFMAKMLVQTSSRQLIAHVSDEQLIFRKNAPFLGEHSL
jgi:hypothetical protein